MGALLLIGLLIVSNVAFLPTLEATICSDTEVKGLFATVFTSVYENGALNVGVIPQYAQYLKDNHVDGVIVASTTGEGPSINVSTNKILLDSWKKACDSVGLLLISNVGAVPLPNALEMSAYSEEIGVDAIMPLPEVYYRPRNASELVYYLRFIYEAAPNTPLIYDDFPEYSDVYVDMEEFYDLAASEIPTFIGVKTNEFETALLLQNKVKDTERIYVADYLYTLAGAYLGFDSFVNAELNYFPELVYDIVSNVQGGYQDTGRSQFDQLRELADIIAEEGNIIAAQKAAMDVITGIAVGPALPPLMPLTDEQIASLEERLEFYTETQE